MHGLDRGHIGAVCDALTGAGIDPTTWSAAQIKAALDAHMRAMGWSWPDRIDKPAAFLASRLRRMLAHRAETAEQSGGNAAASQDSEQIPTGQSLDARQPSSPAKPTSAPAPATPQQRTKHSTAIRQAIAATHKGRTSATSPLVKPLDRRARIHERSSPPTTPATAACVACAGPDAARRPFLPPHRAHVCDSCWEPTT